MAQFIALDSFITMENNPLIEAVTSAIDAWRDSPETLTITVRSLIESLPDTVEVVNQIFITILLNKYTVNLQKIAVEIGSGLGYHSTPEAARIGAEIVGILFGSNCGVVGLSEDAEGTIHVEPLIFLSKAEQREIAKLTFIPPNPQPQHWKDDRTNRGGFSWETKSVILGKRTHHREPVSLDVLNKLQQIPYTVDFDTIVAEKANLGSKQKPSENRKFGYKWSEIIGDYIDETFYFTYRFDTRGRIYSSGYQINPQGNELAKAIVSPQKSELCTEEGIKALEAHLEDLIADGKLILARKAARNLQLAYAGRPINYHMEIDASSSGAQMLSVLSGCTKTAKLCNLTDAPKQDLYQSVLDHMDTDKPYTRKETKKAIMTSMYNSKKTPKDTFGSDLNTFWDTLYELCPGAMEAMEAINACFDPTAEVRTFIMPDGHVVRVPVKLDVSKRITINSLGSRRMTLKYKDNQPNQADKSLPANVAHSVDSLVIREVIRKATFDITPLHDAFFVHPNNVAAVKQLYREVMSEVAAMPLLDSICSQLLGREVDLKIDRSELPGQILKSKYALV